MQKGIVLNFLAHIYLSGENSGLIIGNFIADMVKGKSYLEYTPEIQAGILLHRKIDFFTDNHPVFRQSKRRIIEEHGRYSGVVIDLYYDHFLAKYWSKYSNENLEDFVCKTYKLFISNFRVLPSKAKYILPFLVRQNWLLNYRNLDALSLIFERMDRRTSYQSGMKNAVFSLKNHYQEIEQDFEEFMPELIRFVADQSQ
ncbi:MAG: DUF479 domain-containing protein [Bacteroidales bacterium]|nr:DUF479 domain-containing protein [Bacteroidales bacterium]